MADWPRRPLQKVDAIGRQAIVHRLAIDPVPTTHRQTSRLALQPLTGRTHQLRLHLAAIGHPILGDALYAPPNVIERALRLLLHACALSFEHPLNGAPSCSCAASPP